MNIGVDEREQTKFDRKDRFDHNLHVPRVSDSKVAEGGKITWNEARFHQNAIRERDGFRERRGPCKTSVNT